MTAANLANLSPSRVARRLTTEIDLEPPGARYGQSPASENRRRPSTIDALDHLIEELPRSGYLAEGSQDAIDIYTHARPHRSARTPGSDLPLRMETFGPLDEMIAQLSQHPENDD